MTATKKHLEHSGVSDDEILEHAKSTIFREQKALGELRNSVDKAISAPFLRAVSLIKQLPGRVIVTGMGKSGHIAAKVAATLASTGTPASFLHAAEASHGDLGMITRNDLVLAISKSGETTELFNVASYTRRFTIPFITITARKASTLAKASDVVIPLPDEPEACPHGLAPTTSTSMQLALGDALALVLLHIRGFTESDFKEYHPGGRLGAALAKVSEVMYASGPLPMVRVGTRLTEAISVLSSHHLGCVVVVDRSDELRGVITDGDISRNLNKKLPNLLVDDVMSSQPKTITPDALVSSALAALHKFHIGVLIVINDSRRPIGLLHLHHLLSQGVI